MGPVTGARGTVAVPEALERDLGWMLGAAFRSYVEAADGEIGHLPGGPRGYQLLAAAVRGQPRNQGALAEELGIDRTVMTYLIDDLESSHLVVRRPDPADRRSRLVEATAAGKAAWRECEKRLRRVEAHVLGALGPDDAAAFKALLRRVACDLQDRDAAGDLCEVAESVKRASSASRLGRRRTPGSRKEGTR